MTATETPTYPRILECGDTEYAFTSGGVHFFRMLNPENLPQERYYRAQDYMQEMSYVVGADYLDTFTVAIKAALNKGDLVAASVLVGQLETRKGWITNIMLLYKYATCIYFAQDEDAARYDPKRAEKHINLWLQEKPDAFFLKSQLSSLLPSSEFVRQSLNRFTELQLKQDAIHTKTLLNALLQLSQNGSANEMISTLQSREAYLKEILTRLGS